MHSDGAARALLLKAIERLDPIALASLVGGLLLVPENLHHTHRLEVLGNLTLAGRATGRSQITRSRARAVVDDLLGAWTGYNDDPWPNLATEAFVYHGGNHVFIPGGTDRMFVLRSMVRAITKSDSLPQDVRERCTRLVQFACSLSDEAVGRAGLRRNDAVPPPGSVVVPPGPRLDRLRDAVTLTLARFEALRASSGILRDDADRFCSVAGTVTEPHPMESFVHLQYAPLARVRDAVIIVAPHLIADAAIRQVLAVAHEMDVGRQLADDLHLVSFFAVEASLERLGLRSVLPPRRSFSETPGAIVSHVIFQCDRDKVQHVMVASDGLDSPPTGPWNTAALAQELAIAKAELEDLIGALEPPVEEWSSMVILAGAGRDFEVSFEVDKIRTWTASAADCEAISYVDARDPLLLWKYQIALDKVTQTTRLMSWAPLDTYALWRGWGRTFAQDNDRPAKLLGVSPDSGEVVRREAVLKRDWRALPSWRKNQITEVGLFEGPDRPIYTSRGSVGQRLEIAVETSGPLVWFVQARDLETDPRAFARLLELARMASFWLAEFAEELKPALAAIPGAPIVVVHIEWTDAPSDVAAAHAYTITADGLTLRICATSQLSETYDDTNEAEREFAAAIVGAIFAAAGLPDAPAVVASVIDRVAPHGVKRLLHAVNVGRNPGFTRAASLPEPRHVQEYDAHEARGVALGTGGPIGLLRGDDARLWMNAAVGRLYERLRADLAEYDGRDALEELLRRYESLVFEDNLRDLTFASVLACAERVPRLRIELEEKISRHARAATATRFLIEHLAAEPPTGRRRSSLAKFDDWIAMAAEIIRLGYASDLGRYGLAAIGVRVEDLGYDLDLGGYGSAASEGRGQRHAERLDLEDGRKRVPHTGVGAKDANSGEAPVLPPHLAELDAGVRAEFGRGLQDLAFFFGEALALADEVKSPVVVAPFEAVVERFSARLDWSRTAVHDCFEHFVLAPRGAFTNVPPGHRSSDIWPWIFNRSLSYLRRPFVRTPDDELHYTPGHVHAASKNLLMLLTTARYRARNKELRAAMDRFTQASSREFVGEVSDVLSERGFIVKTHVDKVGGLKIERSRGHGLGDVDVLAADHASRRIIAIECKDLQLDRMPHEMSTDMQALFVGTETKPSAQDKHLDRLRWLEEHRDHIVRSLGGENSERWRIDAAMVLSRALVTPYLGKARIPVWTLRQIRRAEGP